jgi:hypothetical protein
MQKRNSHQFGAIPFLLICLILFILSFLIPLIKTNSKGNPEGTNKVTSDYITRIMNSKVNPTYSYGDNHKCTYKTSSERCLKTLYRIKMDRIEIKAAGIVPPINVNIFMIFVNHGASKPCT